MTVLITVAVTAFALFVAYLLRYKLGWESVPPDFVLHFYVGGGVGAGALFLSRLAFASPLSHVGSALFITSLGVVTWEIFEWHMWNEGALLFGAQFAKPRDVVEDFCVSLGGVLAISGYYLYWMKRYNRPVPLY